MPVLNSLRELLELLEERDFIRREIEKLVDDGIDLALGLLDFRRQAANFLAFLS